MSAVNFQGPIDRPALVNGVLGRVFGVSRSGFLRAGQTLADLDADDWSRVLGVFRRSAAAVLDAHTGRALQADGETPMTGAAAHPVTAILLREARALRLALQPVLASVRDLGCHVDACAEDVAAQGDMVTVALVSLERSIEDGASTDELRVEIGVIVGMLDALGQRLTTGTPEGEAAAIGLRATLSRLECLSDALIEGWMCAPVADALQTVEQCGRCIEEGIADVREAARAFGLGDCDMRRPLDAAGAGSLDAMLTSLARGWALAGQLAALDGGGVLQEVARTARSAAERLSQQLQKVNPGTLAQEFGLADEDAERLHRLLDRLVRRAERCERVLRGLGRGRALFTRAGGELKAQSAEATSAKEVGGADRGAAGSASTAAAARRTSRPTAGGGRRGSPAPASTQAVAPSADTAPM